MAEVLSQSQIDALLNSMQGGGSEEKQEEKPEEKKPEYKKYDFYSPKKFTKDKLKMVQGIYENYARIVSSRLNAILRVSSEIEVLAVEEQRYYEFSNGLSDSDIIMLSNLELPDESKNPPMIVHINQILMVNMIDRMLGGLGNDTDIDASYTYTEIELSLYQRVMGYVLGATTDAWGNYIKISLGDNRLEENPSLFQDISLDETVVIVMLKVKMEKVDGLISVCIPGNLLSNIFRIIDKRKNTHSDYTKDADRARASIMQKIKDSALTVSADLGDAKVSLKDVYGLKVGDVLDLNKPKDTPVSVLIDEEPWFTGNVGIHKKSVAIKIQKRIDREEDDEDNNGQTEEHSEEQGEQSDVPEAPSEQVSE